MKWLLTYAVLLSFVIIFNRRYRVLNFMLKNAVFRKYSVRFLMRLPGVRERFMFQTFNSPLQEQMN